MAPGFGNLLFVPLGVLAVTITPHTAVALDYPTTTGTYFGWISGGKHKRRRRHRLRPLAVTLSTRVDPLPDLPPIGEFLPGYDGSLWQGLAAPKDTPPETINKLSVEINSARSDPQFKSPRSAEPHRSFPPLRHRH